MFFQCCIFPPFHFVSFYCLPGWRQTDLKSGDIWLFGGLLFGLFQLLLCILPLFFLSHTFCLAKNTHSHTCRVIVHHLAAIRVISASSFGCFQVYCFAGILICFSWETECLWSQYGKMLLVFHGDPAMSSCLSEKNIVVIFLLCFSFSDFLGEFLPLSMFIVVVVEIVWKSYCLELLLLSYSKVCFSFLSFHVLC